MAGLARVQAVLVPVAALLRRLRGLPSSERRAAEVSDVRRRIAAAARAPASGETRELARQLRALRAEALAAFDGDAAWVSPCQTCAQGRPAPHGRWSGGFCCGGATAGVFDADEVAALALGGTLPGQLRAPDGEQAGCAFRGPEGCSLDAADRPTLCVRFACRELEASLRAAGRWERVRERTRALERAFARFQSARAADAG